MLTWHAKVTPHKIKLDYLHILALIRFAFPRLLGVFLTLVVILHTVLANLYV